MAVITALEFNDFVPAGVATGQTYRAHGRFGAGADHSDHINRWHQFANPFGHQCFNFGRCAKTQAFVRSQLDRRDDLRVGVA